MPRKIRNSKHQGMYKFSYFSVGNFLSYFNYFTGRPIPGASEAIF